MPEKASAAERLSTVHSSDRDQVPSRVSADGCPDGETKRGGADLLLLQGGKSDTIFRDQTRNSW